MFEEVWSHTAEDGALEAGGSEDGGFFGGDVVSGLIGKGSDLLDSFAGAGASGAVDAMTGAVGGGLGALSMIPSITGGEAKSGNGDSIQNNGATFEGLNYGGTGISPIVLAGLVVVIFFACKKLC